MKTINIKGKEYVPVAERIKYFRAAEEYKNWRIITEIISMDEKRVVMKASVLNQDGIVISTGHAYEDYGSTFINKTSYLEVCETSASGRALGLLGIGIDESIAAAEEVVNAMLNQGGQASTKPLVERQKVLPSKERLTKILASAQSYNGLELLWKNHAAEIKKLSEDDLSSLLDIKESLKEKFEIAKEDINF
uniref:Uncharacterized protein n=1 Tax=viral metagenome TaxID=1070528 RepID=A0A6M3J1F2_9ZZZZ